MTKTSLKELQCFSLNHLFEEQRYDRKHALIGKRTGFTIDAINRLMDEEARGFRSLPLEQKYRLASDRKELMN